MQYWLLRNNIENGPFTKDALLHHGLKSSDQVKIEGEDQWRPVNTFAELKTALESVAKPKYKFTADKQLVEIKSEEKPAPTRNIPTEESVPPSPFKRTPSAVPKKKASAAQTSSHSSTSTGTTNTGEQEKINFRKERNAEAAQPFTKSNTVHHIEQAPKLEHRHKLAPKPVKSPRRANNSNFVKEFFLPIIIIGGIGVLIWWGYKKFTTPGEQFPGQNTAAVLPDSAAEKRINNQDSINALPKSRPATSTVKSDAPRRDSLAIAAASAARRDSLAAARKKTALAAGSKATTVSSESTATALQSKVVTPEKTTAPAKGSNADTPKESTTAKAPVTKPKETPKATDTKKTATKKPSSISDYITMSLNKVPENGIRNVKIQVHNTSNESLNIAIIEVRYFDAAGKFIKGETLQTGKIEAGKTATVKIPNSKEANRISYKASLISGDNVYLMGK